MYLEHVSTEMLLAAARVSIRRACLACRRDLLTEEVDVVEDRVCLPPWGIGDPSDM